LFKKNNDGGSEKNIFQYVEDIGKIPVFFKGLSIDLIRQHVDKEGTSKVKHDSKDNPEMKPAIN
jgi:hypothetical protein